MKLLLKISLIFITLLFAFQPIYSNPVYERVEIINGEAAIPPPDEEQRFMDDQIFGNVRYYYLKFLDRTYEVSAKRDFNNLAVILLVNETSHPHSFYCTVDNTSIPDLGVDFVGLGSDQIPLTIDPFAKQALFLKLHTQNATKLQYQFPIRLHKYPSGEVIDTAAVKLGLYPASLEVILQETSQHPNSLVKSFTLTNIGTRVIPDLTIDFQSDRVNGLMDPMIKQYRLDSQESLSFQVLLADQVEENFPVDPSGNLIIRGNNREEMQFIEWDEPSDRPDPMTKRDAAALLEWNGAINLNQENAELYFRIPYVQWQQPTAEENQLIRSILSSYQYHHQLHQQHRYTYQYTDYEWRREYSGTHQEQHPYIVTDYYKDRSFDTLQISYNDDDAYYCVHQSSYLKTNIKGIYVVATVNPVEDIETFSDFSLGLSVENKTLLTPARNYYGSVIFEVNPALLLSSENGNEMEVSLSLSNRSSDGSLLIINEVKVLIFYSQIQGIPLSQSQQNTPTRFPLELDLQTNACFGLFINHQQNHPQDYTKPNHIYFDNFNEMETEVDIIIRKYPRPLNFYEITYSAVLSSMEESVSQYKNALTNDTLGNAVNCQNVADAFNAEQSYHAYSITVENMEAELQNNCLQTNQQLLMLLMDPTLSPEVYAKNTLAAREILRSDNSGVPMWIKSLFIDDFDRLYFQDLGRYYN